MSTAPSWPRVPEEGAGPRPQSGSFENFRPKLLSVLDHPLKGRCEQLTSVMRSGESGLPEKVLIALHLHVHLSPFSPLGCEGESGRQMTQAAT